MLFDIAYNKIWTVKQDRSNCEVRTVAADDQAVCATD